MAKKRGKDRDAPVVCVPERKELEKGPGRVALKKGGKGHLLSRWREGRSGGTSEDIRDRTGRSSQCGEKGGSVR